jgi:hypothetical protein
MNNNLPTPEAMERTAWDCVFEELGAHDQRVTGGLAPNLTRFTASLDAYRTAVRAALVAEMQAAPPQDRVSGSKWLDAESIAAVKAFTRNHLTAVRAALSAERGRDATA